MRVVIVAFEGDLLKCLQMINLQKVDVAAIVTAYTVKVAKIVKFYALSGMVFDYDELERCLKEVYYDKVIVFGDDEYEMIKELRSFDVKKDDIINFRMLRVNHYFSLYNLLHEYRNHSANYQTLITGMSYEVFGINGQQLYRNGIKFALGNQDLYYDNKIMQEVFDTPGQVFTTAIIGLSPYRLNWDLSKTNENYMCLSYYTALKDLHHFPIGNDEATDFFSEEFLNLRPGSYEIDIDNATMLRDTKNYVIGIKEIKRARKDVIRWEGNGYPDTFQENVQILREMLAKLNERGIKTFLLTQPVTKYYRRHFSRWLLSQFYSTIGELKKEYDFEHLDYWESDDFEIRDFWDSCHLNRNGAEKLTKLLNRDIWGV